MSNRYDPNKHHRRSIRLRGWDYTASGAYFITICTHQRDNLFDHTPFREVAENAWRNIPTHAHAQHVTLDEWVLMPNHLHGILFIGRGEATGKDVSVSNGALDPVASPLLQPGSIGAIVGNFKSLVARRINNLRRTPGAKVWQRGYYDRIVRNERELNAIRQYIRDNLARWAEDRENLEALVSRMRCLT